MVNFVGAGCGAADLITVRGLRLIKEADVIIYAGSLVNPELLKDAKKDCAVYDSAKMTLEQVLAVMKQAEAEGKKTVRLHTGDPSLYGAIREQMDALSEAGISFEVCPGVSSFSGAAASLKAELTLPGVSQTVILTRMAGRTSVPERESFRSLAAHHATMAVFLSAGLLKEMEEELLDRMNRLGIGPQGLGGVTTVLGVNVEFYPTHIAGMPIAVNISCHVTRHAEVVL